MQTIITLIVFLLILGTIIIIHEFGHFIAAKIFGVYCSHFSIGFGPKIWSKKEKKQNTKFEHYHLVVLFQWQVKNKVMMKN